MEIEAGRGREGPMEGRTPGADREMGSGRGRQRGGEWTRETSDTVMRCGNPGARRDLGSRLKTEREGRAETSGGVRR